MNTKVLRELSYGVYLVTALDGMRPSGCIANSVMQISSNPPTVAVSLNKTNYTTELIARHGYFAVTVLAQDTAPALIGTFGFQSGRTANKFDGLDFTFEEGAPVPTAAAVQSCGWFSCKVTGSYDAGTHTVLFAQVTDAELRSGTPMTYRYYHEVIKGRSPKAAPTYQPEEPAPAAAPVWKCSVCGYIYEGSTLFEQLPESYACPLCRQPKSAFVQA